jgi:hypothetical protein
MSAKYKNTISMRIRFMIQDTIELKDNDWVPRNIRPKQEVCNPKISSKPEKLSAPALNVLSTVIYIYFFINSTKVMILVT